MNVRASPLRLSYAVRGLSREPEAVVGALAALFARTAPADAPPFAAFFDEAPPSAAVALPDRLLDALPAFDPLGELYQSLQERSHRKRSGVFYTPQARAEDLVSRCDGGASTAVDPACGSGRLLVVAFTRSPGLQVFGMDLDAVAVAICRAQLWLAGAGSVADLRKRIVVGDGLAEPPPVFPSAFDLILANPPYIAHYSRGSQRSTATEGRVARGRYHSAAHFLEVWAARLRPAGRLGFLVPDSLLTARSFAPLRARLDAMGAPCYADRSLGADTFHRATVGEALLVWERGRPHEGPACASWLAVASPELVGDWIPLGEVAWARDGVNPGSAATRARVLADRPCGPDWVPVLVGGDIEPFRLRAPGKWVWMSTEALSADDKRRGASLRQRWVFAPNRIVTRQTADRPIAAIEHNGNPTLNSAHNVGLLEPKETVLRALCAYLNSDLAAELLRAASGEIRASFPQVHLATLRELPVPAALCDAAHPDTLALADWHDRLAGDASLSAAFQAWVNDRYRASADQPFKEPELLKGDHVGMGREATFALPCAERPDR